MDFKGLERRIQLYKILKNQEYLERNGASKEKIKDYLANVDTNKKKLDKNF